jgi:hypothetical protein
VSDTVAAPIFTATTPSGRKDYGLFGLMATATRGELIDLPRMAGHQRSLVITVLAISMHVLARYTKVDRASEKSWARAWDDLIGPDALRVTAPHDCMSSEHFGQLAWQFKRMSGSSGLKVQAAIAC